MLPIIIHSIFTIWMVITLQCTNVADQQQPKTSNVLCPLLALAVPTITVLYNFSNLLLMIWEASLIFWKTLWELFINWPYFSSLKSVANKWDLLDPNGSKIESYTDIRDQVIIFSFLTICKNDGQIYKKLYLVDKTWGILTFSLLHVLSQNYLIRLIIIWLE